MSKKPHSEKSKAELLIEEAVRAVEREEVEEESLTGIRLKEHPSVEVERTSSPIVKIDLQQFVEKEAYLKLAADFENFRKRSLKERKESERNGREKALRNFLEILDNLERGLNQAAGDESALADGMRMVLSQAEIWLKTEGLERIETSGVLFDPALHEAVSNKEDPSQPSGIILEEIKRGYRWHDRLLRPAAVVVCKNSREVETQRRLEETEL